MEPPTGNQPSNGNNDEADSLPIKRAKPDAFAAPGDMLGGAPATAGLGSAASSLWGVNEMQGIRADTGMTPTPGGGGKRSRWGATPTPNRWGDDTGAIATPSMATGNWGQTPMVGQTPVVGGGVGIGQTPMVSVGGAWATPAGGQAGFGATPAPFAEGGAQSNPFLPKIAAKEEHLRREWQQRNEYLTDEALDAMLPSEGFSVVPVPANYEPKVNHEEPSFRDIATRLVQQETGIQIPVAAGTGPKRYEIPDSLGDHLPKMEPADAQAFELLLRFANVPDESLPADEAHNVMVMRNLFRIKRGDANQRRMGMQHLTNRDKVHRLFGPQLIFDKIFEVWQSRVLDEVEQGQYIKLIKKLMLVVGAEKLTPFCRIIVGTMQPLLNDNDRMVREDGRGVISNLARLVGVMEILKAVSVDVESEDKIIRHSTALAVAVATRACGIDAVKGFIFEMVTNSKMSDQARHTAVKIIHELATLMGSAILRNLGDMTDLLGRLIEDRQLQVKIDAALALAEVAEVAHPYGFECFEPLIRPIRRQISNSNGRTLGAFLRALGSIVPLMPVAEAEKHTKDLVSQLVPQFRDYHDEELRRVVLTVLRQCVETDGVTPKFIKEVLWTPFFEGFWMLKRTVSDKRAAVLLMDATVAMAKKLGSAEVLDKLAPAMKEAEDTHQRVLADCIKQVVEASGTVDLTDQQVSVLMDAALYAFQLDQTGFNFAVVYCLATCMNSLKERIRGALPQIVDEISRRFVDRDSQIREQAANVGHLCAKAIVACPDSKRCVDELCSLYFRSLEAEQEPRPLGAALRALRSFITELPDPTVIADPHMGQLHHQVTLLIAGNQEPNVQIESILLVGEIIKKCPKEIAKEEMQELAMKHLLHLLHSQRRSTRNATAEVYGLIAEVMMPYNVIVRLVKNMEKDDRRDRIATSVALAVIAKRSGPFEVLPFILNAYRECEGPPAHPNCQTIQHAVLKTLRFMFDYLGTDGKDYVYMVVPLLQRAMTENSYYHRRQAIEAAKTVIMCCAGEDSNHEDLVIHLLNYAHPNIVEMLSGATSKDKEERNRLVTAVVQLFEAATLIVGGQVIYQYLVQGLFHPAFKVRDIYWRTYNMVYLQNPEGMIQAHPRILPDPSESEADPPAHRQELYVIV